MIDKALSFLLAEINGHLGRRFPSDTEHAILSPVTKQDGTPPEETANKIVLTLVGIERDSAATATAPPHSNVMESTLMARVAPTFVPSERAASSPRAMALS